MEGRIFYIAICDDEVQIANLLEKKILDYSMKYNMDYRIHIYHDGRSLLEQLDEKTDILFMDVEMPGLNGIETATELRKKNQNIQIVFLSAYREYVFESFKVRAFRYLLKPLRDEDFKEVMDQLSNLWSTIPRLEYSFGSEHYSINYSDILYIEGMRGKIFIYCTNGTYRWRGALSGLYEEFDMKSQNLFLIHRSYIVNMHKIIRYTSQEVVLEGDHIVPISKHRLNEFKKEYIRLWGDSLSFK